MKSFLAACAACAVISVVAFYGLHETSWANSGERQSSPGSVRLD